MPRTRRVVAGALLLAAPLAAQDMEPRGLQNAPVGMNLVGAVTGYSRGNLLVDPAVPIEDARAFVGELTRVSRSPVAFAELPLAQHAFEVFL